MNVVLNTLHLVFVDNQPTRVQHSFNNLTVQWKSIVNFTEKRMKKSKDFFPGMQTVNLSFKGTENAK